MPVSLQKQNEHLLQLLQDAMPAVASASLQPHGEQVRKTLQAIKEALAERYEPALSLNSVLGAVLQAGNAEAEKPLLSAEDVYKRLSPEAKARTSIDKVGDMLAKLGEPLSSDQSQSDLLEEQRELPGYLNDAIDNLVHDNYEQGEEGSRCRQADADLIRAGVNAYINQLGSKVANLSGGSDPALSLDAVLSAVLPDSFPMTSKPEPGPGQNDRECSCCSRGRDRGDFCDSCRDDYFSNYRPAQTEQQPVQSELITIQRWILERFLEVDEALDKEGRTIENLANYDLAVGCIRRAISAPILQTAPHMDDVTAAVRNLRCIAKTVLSSESRASMRADLESAAQLLIKLSATQPEKSEVISAAQETVEYLNSNTQNSIASGSKCHRRLRDALAEESQSAPRPSWLDGGQEALAMAKEDAASAERPAEGGEQ